MAEENGENEELNEPTDEVGEKGEVLPEPEAEIGEEAVEELPEEELPEVPVFMGDEEPTAKEDKAKYWILREPDWTNEEIAERKDLNTNTVRIARSHLADDGYIKRERKLLARKTGPGTAVETRAAGKGMQVFAKGSPPEALIESIAIPMVDGQSQGFEQGMKFGMTQLVLAVRIMQELSAVAQSQVKPLIDLVRTVREGEAAAFKGGADEGALKAAQAMGATIMPMMSEMQTAVVNASKGSEADPMKAMMVRTMEPLLKGLLGRMVPGMKDEPPSGWTRKTE